MREGWRVRGRDEGRLGGVQEGIRKEEIKGGMEEDKSENSW
jgi:hypothetical protein